MDIRPAPPPDRYDRISILLHWLTLVLLCVLFGLGWYMVDLPIGSAERSYFFALHKSVGLTTAVVVIFRAGWRIAHPAPPLPDAIDILRRKLARITHVLLYVTLLLQPLSGYLSSSFTRYPTRWWGIPLPQWGWQDAALNEFFTEIHVANSVALLCLIVLHVLGALSHIAGPDNVLPRMLPSRRRPASRVAGPAGSAGK